MNGWLLAQTQVDPNAPDYSTAIRRLVQNGLWDPALGEGTVFLYWLLFIGVVSAITLAISRDLGDWAKGFFDIRAHLARLARGAEAIRYNKRPFWIVLMAAVGSWTGWALVPANWSDIANIDELESLVAVHENSRVGFATSQSILAALSPLRDLINLGDLITMVAVAGLFLFSRTTELSIHLRQRLSPFEAHRHHQILGILWVCSVLLVGARTLMLIIGGEKSPLVGAVYFDAAVVPPLLLLADGALIAWVLTELGMGFRLRSHWEAEDSVALARGVLPCCLLCLIAHPGRYLLLGGGILQYQLTDKSWSEPIWLWALNYSPLFQIGGLVIMPILGVLVCSRPPGISKLLVQSYRLLRDAGGKVPGMFVTSSALAWLVTWPVFWLFSAMQTESWSLVGATSYSHYATLLTGFLILAGWCELARTEQPVTTASEEEVSIQEPLENPALAGSTP